MSLWRWYRSPIGKLWLEDSFDAASKGLDQKTVDLLHSMYGAELTRLFDADPISVSSGMCDVIEAASPTLRPEPLLETDLITTRGFMYFGRAIVTEDGFSNPIDIAGASWVRLFHSFNKATLDKTEKEMQSYADNRRSGGKTSMRELEDRLLLEEPDIQAYGIALTIYASTLGDGAFSSDVHDLYPGQIPGLVPIHLTPWYFGMSLDGEEWNDQQQPLGAEWWWRIIQTSFRLMQQRIATKGFGRPDKSARREAARLKYPPDTEVVVVRLRRESGEREEPTGESANYSHRFIVGGHWRNQWYATEEIHRQIWISPYVKGPADKPLIVKPRRVFQWDR